MTKKTTASSEKLFHNTIPSPVGPIRIIASDKHVRAILFRDGAGERNEALRGSVRNPNHKIIKKAVEQLREYFAGERHNFSLPLSAEGTEFQRACWRVLQKIPYGQTICYGEQARRVGDSKKARAVGGANGKNPIPIVIPCHRVIGANGSLTGFSSGISIKRALLALEQKV